MVSIVLLFAVAVMVLIVVNPDDLPLCDDVASGAAKLGSTLECLDSSSGVYNVQRVLAGITGLIGLAAALLGLYAGATGRRFRLWIQLTAAAILFGVLTFLMRVL